MTKSDIIEELGLELDVGYKENKDVEKLFKERQDDREDLLKESIADIQNMIKTREDLHKELLKTFDKIILSIDNSTPKASSQGGDMKSLQDFVKETFKKKIEIEELKTQEKLNFWRDVASLKQELREHMKEFRDMQSKSTMLDNILG